MVDAAVSALYQRFLPGDQPRSFVWKYSPAGGGRRPRHFHAEPEVNLVVRGSATFGIGSGEVRVSQGDILAFPAGQDHALLEGSDDLYMYAIGLDAGYSAAVLGATSEITAPLHVRLAASEAERVGDCAEAIVDRRDAEQLGAELWQRLHWLGRRTAERASRPTHVLTRRALRLIAAAPELGLAEVASELRAHPSEVSRHFHHDVKMTLVRYRTRQRLLRVIGMVDASGRDLTSAASEAGFGSYSQCHRAFRAELGCSPRDFFASGAREAMQHTYAL